MSPFSRPRASSSPIRRRSLRIAAIATIAAGAAGVMAVGQPAGAGTDPPAPAPSTVLLATAANYSVLGASTVTNTGNSVIGQNVGLSPGTSIVGFPPGIVLAPATIQAHNAVTEQAQLDLTTAYVDAADRDLDFTLPNSDLVGQTLIPGVYAADSKAPLGLSGSLVLDGQNNEDAVFIFQTDSTLITSSGSTISLINGASECNVFWQVGSSATLGSGSFFVGNILALASVTVESSTVVHGRALAQTAAVTLDNNVFTEPDCTPATDDTPTATAPATTVAAPTTTVAAVPLPSATTAPATATTTVDSGTIPGDTTGNPDADTTPPGSATTAPGSATSNPDGSATTNPDGTPTLPPGDTPTTFGQPTLPFPDVTLPATGTSVDAASSLAIATLLLGLAAVFLARRGRPA